MIRDIPVLVISYKRALNVERIVDICRASGITRIYFAVDGPVSKSDLVEVDSVKETILRLIEDINIQSYLKFEKENLGCAAAVISAIDWFFENESAGVILEDDCIPTKDFFDFMQDSIPVIQSNADIWLASGTQFFPGAIKANNWALSNYPMHWGWGTTSSAWKEFKYELKYNPPTFKKFVHSILNLELIYWFAGERRAFYGFTDVWDSIYASNMFRLRKFSIVPSSNLVTNTGDDSFATNTTGQEKYTQLKTAKYQKSFSEPQHSQEYDLIIRKNFFRISMRHYFSTFYTLVLDYLFAGRKKYPHLDSRIKLFIPT